MTKKIYEDGQLVVYKREEQEVIHIYVHAKAEGKEVVPRTYTVGANAIVFKLEGESNGSRNDRPG